MVVVIRVKRVEEVRFRVRNLILQVGNIAR